MSIPHSPLPAKGPRNGDLPAYISNGLVGLRVREVPFMPGMALVSGVAGDHRDRRIEAATPCPYPLAGDVAIDGVWMSDQPWGVSDLVQTYDFGTAELTSEFGFAVGDKRIKVEIVTFACRTAPSLVLQKVTVRPEAAMTLGLRAVVETAGVRGTLAARRTETPGEPEAVCDGSLLWETEGRISSCGIALATSINADDVRPERKPWDLNGPLVSEYEVMVRKGAPTVMRQMAAMVPSAMHSRPEG